MSGRLRLLELTCQHCKRVMLDDEAEQDFQHDNRLNCPYCGEDLG